MLQAEVKSLCTVKTSTLNMAQDPGSAPSVQPPPHSLPTTLQHPVGFTQPQGKGWGLSPPRDRHRRTHAGDGILQQELGPLPPRHSPLLLLELPRQQAARQGGGEAVGP